MSMMVFNRFPELGEKVFELIEPFAGYAFNKAHSVSSAMIGYWTAYFKANYPEIFMSVLMKNSSDDKEKISVLITECNSMNIAVSGPNINMSVGDMVGIDHKKISPNETFRVTKINSKNIKVQGDRGSYTVAPSLLVKKTFTTEVYS
jgi:DNA polymerase III alpha subunit